MPWSVQGLEGPSDMHYSDLAAVALVLADDGARTGLFALDLSTNSVTVAQNSAGASEASAKTVRWANSSAEALDIVLLSRKSIAGARIWTLAPPHCVHSATRRS